MKLHCFNPQDCHFPKPRISALPNLPSIPTMLREKKRAVDNRNAQHFRHFSRGRYALMQACRLAGLNRQTTFFAPAYHCVTMIDPALAIGAEIRLFRLNNKLSPDLAHLAELLSVNKSPVRALLATHYFGLVQDFRSLRNFCRAQQIILIEDCSHVLFTEDFRASGSGEYGDLVIASPYKFFSCADGGLLYAPEADRLAHVVTKKPSLIDELSAIKSTYEKGRGSNGAGNRIDIDSTLESLDRLPLKLGFDAIEERSSPSQHYSSAIECRSSLRYSRLMVRQTSAIEVGRKRRENFNRWAAVIAQLPNCQALFNELPKDCIPYMFPVRIDHPTPHFYWLKHLGVPIWRWDEMGASSCSISADSRLHLLHLPCHQALTEEQMNWMAEVFAKTMLRTKGKQ